jgi:hypothetical protein
LVDFGKTLLLKCCRYIHLPILLQQKKDYEIPVQAAPNQSTLHLHESTAREPGIVSAAYFGSWGKALFAAGIDPNLYFVHRTWRKAA